MMPKSIHWIACCCLAASLWAQSTIKIEGVVTDAVTGQPLQDVNILVSGTGIGTVTDSRGRFQIERLFTGSYTIVATHIGYKKEEVEDIQILPGQPQFTKIVMKAATIPMPSVSVEADRQTVTDNFRTVVISGEAIRASSAQTLTDILASVPGIDIQSSGGREASQKISIRGSETNQVLVLLDGVPVNDALTGGSDLSQIPLHMVDSIEITRGAASADQGSGAIGGTIQIHSRRPMENTVEVRSAAGSFGHRLLESSLSTRLRKVDFSVSYQTMQSENDYAYSYQPLYGEKIEDTRTNADMKSHSIFTLLGFRTGAHSLSAMAHVMKSERGIPGRIDQWTGYAREKNDRTILGMTYQGKGLDLSYRYHDFHVTQKNLWPEDSELKYRGPMQYNYASKIRTHFESAGFSRDLGKGLNARLKMDGRQLRFSDENLLSQSSGPVDTAEDNSFGVVFSPSMHCAFAKKRLQFQIDPALRYDRINVHDSETRRVHEQWSPSLSVQSDLGGAQRVFLRGHISRAFRAPTFADLFYQDLRIQGKPDLLPEKSFYREVAAGVLGHAKGEWHLEWTRFFSDVEDLICWRLGSFETFRPYNTDADISGNEWLAGYTAPSEWLSWNLCYETLNPVNHDPALTAYGKMIPYKPLESVKTTFNFQFDWVKLTGHYRWIGKRYVTESNTLALDPYRLLDLSLTVHGVRRRIGWEANFSALNVTNTHYEIIYKMPLAPRSFLLSAKVSLLPSP